MESNHARIESSPFTVVGEYELWDGSNNRCPFLVGAVEVTIGKDVGLWIEVKEEREEDQAVDIVRPVWILRCECRFFSGGQLTRRW